MELDASKIKVRDHAPGLTNRPDEECIETLCLARLRIFV